MPVLHHVHCVDFLWRWANSDEWDYRTIMNTTERMFEIHANHCYITLKTLIECNSDVSPVVFQWDSSEMGEWRTADVPHRCKKWDVITEWIDKNKICPLTCGVDVVPVMDFA